MKRGGGVHTVPKPEGSGWVNEVNGKILSRHRSKEVAVVAGRDDAQAAQVGADDPP